MTPIGNLVTRGASRLRFPTLLRLFAILFVIDLFVPDLIPWVDEILLGLATAVLATWRRTNEESVSGTTPHPR